MGSNGVEVVSSGVVDEDVVTSAVVLVVGAAVVVRNGAHTLGASNPYMQLYSQLYVQLNSPHGAEHWVQ